MDVRKDYELFLQEVGITEEVVEQAMATAPAPLPRGEDDPYTLMDSEIDGTGVFAAKDLAAGQSLGLWQVDGEWTEGGRYCNHSPEPNGKVVMLQGALKVVAAKDISVGDEITINYRDMRECLKLQGLGVLVIDDFCPEAKLVRESALIAGISTWLPTKGEVGSSVYEGMGFWGDHAFMIRSLMGAVRSVVTPNSMFFRVTNTDMEEAYIHSDRASGDHTCVVYLSEHDEPYGTAFYRYLPTGELEMPDLYEIEGTDLSENLKADMVSRDPEKWEKVAFVEGKYNRAVIFPAPLFHSRYPYAGIGNDPQNGRLVWASHFYKMNGYGQLY